MPDVPADLAMPRACGANTMPIAFAEVGLARQDGTAEAQENPVPTIEAKKCFEVQKHIELTGHIVDHPNTVIAGGLWQKRSEADRKLFADVAREAAAKAPQAVAARAGAAPEKALVGIFRTQGIPVSEVNTAEFHDTVLKNVPVEPFGCQKADRKHNQALKQACRRDPAALPHGPPA